MRFSQKKLILFILYPQIFALLPTQKENSNKVLLMGQQAKKLRRNKIIRQNGTSYSRPRNLQEAEVLQAQISPYIRKVGPETGLGRGRKKTCEAQATFHLYLLQISICEVKSNCRQLSHEQQECMAERTIRDESRYDNKITLIAVLFTISTPTQSFIKGVYVSGYSK